MYQLELYMKGERDYSLITGPTGPIVYVSSFIPIGTVLTRVRVRSHADTQLDMSTCTNFCIP